MDQSKNSQESKKKKKKQPETQSQEVRLALASSLVVHQEPANLPQSFKYSQETGKDYLTMKMTYTWLQQPFYLEKKKKPLIPELLGT